MKPFCWLILAGCVGAFGLGSLSSAADGSAPGAVPPGDSAGIVPVRDPARPDDRPGPGWAAPDFDPESLDDEEARLVGPGAVASLLAGLRVWCLPAMAKPAPGRRTTTGRPSRFEFPIRC